MTIGEYKVSLSHEIADPHWDRFITNSPSGEYEQSCLWAEVKSLYGWKPIRIVVTRDDGIIAGMQILIRSIPVMGAIGYVSKGPVFNVYKPALIQIVINKLKDILRKNRIQYLIVHPPQKGSFITDYLTESGFKMGSVVDVVKATTIIDLTADLDNIFKNISKTTRSRIRFGQRKGVKIQEGSKENISHFYHLMLETCRRQRVIPNPADEGFLHKLWQIFYPHGHVRLFITKYKGEILSGAYAILFKDTFSVYKIGWSGRNGNLKPNHVLHWEMIKWAKDQGFRYFDFFGIDRNAADRILQGTNYSKVASGPSLFKLMFKGQVIILPDAYEYIYNPILRWGYNTIFSGNREWASVQKMIKIL